MPIEKVKRSRIDLPTLLGAAVIACATFAVYWPAIRGDFIWDDPDYVVNNPTLRDLPGLLRIWTEPRSLPQWYPMVHTTFWIEYQFFGLNPVGYHLGNVLLHIASSLLLWKLLRVLEVPGAWLAAASFALHPVQVESVAWITERKNVLSGFFALLAMLAYLRFDRTMRRRDAAAIEPQNASAQLPGPPSHHHRRQYVISLALFIAALLSKSVTATLPAAILVIIWWKRRRIELRRDVLPLTPFFILGIAMGLLTAYLEHTHVGASGATIAEFNLSPIDRILIAGRVIVFYAQKLLVPWPLVFIYPRWRIDPGVWWQWLFPAAVLIVLITLLAAQKRLGRGPAAAVMLFCGLLFPALGFVNVYPMRFSFVADHFQYHASAAMIALLAAIAWKLASRPAVVLLIPLAVLTRLRTPVYSDSITLWRDTLEKNPNSWMVHTNLAHALVAAADRTADSRLYAEAEQHYLAAYDLDPNIPETNLNTGIVLARRNQIDKALAHLQRALELSPEFPPILLTIGQVYERNNDLDRAIEYYRKALEIDPKYVDANYRIGGALIATGRYDQAAQHLRQAVQLDPRHAEAWLRLGFAQRQLGQMEAAEQSFRTALQLRPELARQILRR